jgi:hypothetical protein
MLTTRGQRCCGCQGGYSITGDIEQHKNHTGRYQWSINRLGVSAREEAWFMVSHSLWSHQSGPITHFRPCLI